MIILVLSDSHSGLSFMREACSIIQPDTVIHLGDYVDDAETLFAEYPRVKAYRVSGNCDRWRMTNCPETIIESIAGVRFYMTHGHLHGVKSYTDKLVRDARNSGAAVVLYGHTHCPDCRRLEDGMWLMNPGSCSSYSGSVGLISISDSHEVQCRVLSASDLEAYR